MGRRMRHFGCALIACCAALAGAQPVEVAQTEDDLQAVAPAADAPAPAPVAPRSLYRISPDGATLAWVEFVEGVDMVIAQARPTTPASQAGQAAPPFVLFYEAPGRVDDIQFSADGRRIVIALEDNAGVLSAPLDRTSPVPAPDGVIRLGDSGESLARLSFGRPRRALLVQRGRTGEVIGAARVDLQTGEREAAAEFTGRAGQLYSPFDVLADATLTVRVVLERGPGGVVRVRRTGANDATVLETRVGAIFRALGLSDDGRLLYAIDGRDRLRTALTVTNIETGETAVLVDDPNVEVDAAMLHPFEGFAQAARFNTSPSQWFVLQRSIADDLRGLRSATDGSYVVASRTSDDALWIVRFDQADGRPEWRLLETATDALTTLPEGAPITELR